MRTGESTDEPTGDRALDPGGDPADPPGSPAPAAPEPAPPGTPRPPAARRDFLRQLSGDAVVTAGKVAGLSALITRSVSAAGSSVARDLERLGGDHADGANEPEPSTSDVTPPAPSTPAPSTPAPAPAADATDPGRAAVDRLTEAQQTILSGITAGTLALNDPGGPPYLAMVALAWDGASFAVPSRWSGARIGHVERDGRAALQLVDPATGAWITVTGIASLEDPDPAGDRVTIRIRPTRFVWGPPAATSDPA